MKIKLREHRTPIKRMENKLKTFMSMLKKKK
jgi:hypothetical protein